MGGDWVVCRPGGTPCCLGPFPITALDALRLQDGLASLAMADAARAERVRSRAGDYCSRIASEYPGDPASGALVEEAELPDGWDEVPCPALDPGSGLCDLYEARPVTCRVFGPAMRLEDGAVGACELCYKGATDAQIAERSVAADPAGHERALVDELGGPATIVAFALIHAKEKVL